MSEVKVAVSSSSRSSITVQRGEEGVAKKGQVLMSIDSHHWEDRPNCQTVMCPVLKTLYNQGMLPCTEEGWVTEKDLAKSFRDGLCLNSVLLEKLIISAEVSPIDKNDLNSEKGMNIFKMNNSIAEHPYGSGVLDPDVPGTHEEKFEEILKHSKNGRFGKQELGDMAERFRKNNPDHTEVSGNGDMFVVGMAFLDAFGRRDDEEFGLYFTNEDMRRLYLDGRPPEGWTRAQWGLVFDVVPQLVEVKVRQLCGLCTIS